MISFNEESTKLRTWDIKRFIWGNKCENPSKLQMISTDIMGSNPTQHSLDLQYQHKTSIKCVIGNRKKYYSWLYLLSCFCALA